MTCNVKIIEDKIYLSDPRVEGRSRLLWEGTRIRSGGEKKGRLSILRDRNLSLRGRRLSSSAVQSFQKWIEWLWVANIIAEILLIYLGVPGTHRLKNELFRFGVVLSVPYPFAESAPR